MTDLLVFAIYIAIVILIGRLNSKKIHSAEDYHLCGRNLGKWPAALSQAATEFSGSGLLGGAGIAYSIGLAGVWWNWSAAPVYIIVGFTVVYLLRKANIGTTAGFIGRHYGAEAQKLAAALQVIGGITFIGVQIKVCMVMLNVLFGLDANVSAALVTGVFVAYTMMGGLWAVVWTDVFQYLILMAGLFLAAGFAYFYVGGIDGLTGNLPDDYFDMSSQGPMLLVSYFMIVILAYSTDQMVIQRGLAAENAKAARFAYLYTGLNYIVFGVCILLIGMSARVILPGLDNHDQALPKLVTEVFPAGLRGVFLTAIIAVAMSTASSALAAGASMLVQDIYEPLTNRAHDKSEKTVVRDSRAATFLIGATAALMAVRYPDVVEMVFVGVALANAPIFFPMMLALFWGKANPKSAAWSMLGALVAGMMSANLWYEKVDGVLGDVHYLVIGPLTGLAIMLGWTLLRPGDRGRTSTTC